MIQTRVIRVSGKEIVLVLNSDGFWQDAEGTLYALDNKEKSFDTVDRCGISPFSLPSWEVFKILNYLCKFHDYLYSCPLYQKYHDRSEADKYLKTLLITAGFKITGEVFYIITRYLGSFAWEVDETRNSYSGIIKTG